MILFPGYGLPSWTPPLPPKKKPSKKQKKKEKMILIGENYTQSTGCLRRFIHVLKWKYYIADLSNSEPVMFYATTRDQEYSFTLEKKSILVFERVVINIGGHYNNIDGIFVAPRQEFIYLPGPSAPLELITYLQNWWWTIQWFPGQEKARPVVIMTVGQWRQSAEWIRINMPGLERLQLDLKIIFILLRKVRSRPSWVL